jgi:hypothetical protein
MLRPFFLVLLLFTGGALAAVPPGHPRALNYSTADSIALHFPRTTTTDCEALARELTAGLSTDQEKFRVLFRWVCDNIAYSYAHRTFDTEHILRHRKAVCGGYSLLLTKMSHAAGIRCEYVAGFPKTLPKGINNPSAEKKHAWNAVYLDGSWYLLDATWASGSYDSKTRKFYKSFSEFYYLTPPGLFALDHFPDRKEWQLMDKPVSKNSFFKAPLIYQGSSDLGIDIEKPAAGEVKLRLKNPFELRFHSATPKETALVSTGKKVYKAQFRTDENGQQVLSHHFEKPGRYVVDIWIDGVAVATFKVTVKG